MISQNLRFTYSMRPCVSVITKLAGLCSAAIKNNLSFSSACLRAVMSRSTETAMCFPSSVRSCPAASTVKTEPSLRLWRTSKVRPSPARAPRTFFISGPEDSGLSLSSDTGLPTISSRV